MAPETLQMLEQWANDVLVWVGFGTIVGLLAKGIMPGRDPGGAVATLAMGVGGTVIGCGVFAYFSGSTERITPISPIGFVVATGGAFILLFFYKLLGGYFFIEGEVPRRRRRPHYTRSRRRSVIYDD
ncbi:MAG: GlsB/YeaQ/YmgE family stress response membrane protein [Pirellulaceae bacterium]|jgi:uncharacterized membrane protein YeaQ/YmgE (transglycosylase-associated protein family)|nr:GlsB/YeaQ/YmgE family stress response membrane protein [Pirellulaceae bacterium]HJN08819.1 GlsB/YeaQ/YmgE family stress response membrane protein [Pirellulaceae bacterium]